LFLCLTNHYATKKYGGKDVQINVFLTLAQLEVSGQLCATAALPPGEISPGTLWIRGCAGPRAGLDDMKKMFDPTGIQTLTSSLYSPQPVTTLTALRQLIILHCILKKIKCCVNAEIVQMFTNRMQWQAVMNTILKHQAR
jgi:hypothetical protein